MKTDLLDSWSSAASLNDGSRGKVGTEFSIQVGK
jgi:hypothetical protein